MTLIDNILKDNRLTPSDVTELEGKLFFEGDRTQRYLVRFTVLLFLSTVIAAEGVSEDSTATVIGAMIIAAGIVLVAIPLSISIARIWGDSAAQVKVTTIANVVGPRLQG